MYSLISININKRLSLISTIFILISLGLMIGLIYYYACFDQSIFQILNNYELYFTNYIFESIQIIELITVIFIMLLVMMEIFYNISNFDSYFVSITGKKKYYFSKITIHLDDGRKFYICAEDALFDGYMTIWD